MQPTASSYRKVAVVENFFDIIYSVHVDLEGRCGKHAGQKRTYRTVSHVYKLCTHILFESGEIYVMKILFFHRLQKHTLFYHARP